MIDRKLMLAYVAGHIAESFKTDLFIIWSEDNSEKLVIQCCVLRGGDKDEDGLGAIEDVFLHQLENTMLSSVNLHGVPGIHSVHVELQFICSEDRAHAALYTCQFVLYHVDIP